MCQPKAEGGQRCHSQAKTRVFAATARYEAAVAAGDRSSAQAAWNNLTVAQEDLASTTQGAAELAEARDAVRRTDRRLYEHLRDVVDTGAYLKARNKALRQAAQDIAEGREPLGRTGHDGVDRMISLVVRELASDPDDYRTAPDVRIPGVKTYQTRAEQAEGIEHWTRRTRAHAAAFDDYRREGGVHTMFTDIVQQFGARENGQLTGDMADWVSENDGQVSRADARQREHAAVLLISAHRLGLAQRQTPDA